MLAEAGCPPSSGVRALASRARVGWPPSGARIEAIASSAAGGSMSRSDTSRRLGGWVEAGSRVSPKSASVGVSDSRSHAAASPVAGLPAANTTLATRPRRRIAWATSSDVTTSGPVACTGRSEKLPMPCDGRTVVTLRRRPSESSVRRPSGLSAGTADRRGSRSTIASPPTRPSVVASGELTRITAGASGGGTGSKPSPAGSLQASRVAAAVLPPADTVTGITIADTIAAGPPPAEPARIRSARSIVKNVSPTRAASIRPKRPRARLRSPVSIERPTHAAPAMVMATTPQAAASATNWGHHCRAKTSASRVREGAGSPI